MEPIPDGIACLAFDEKMRGIVTESTNRNGMKVGRYLVT